MSALAISASLKHTGPSQSAWLLALGVALALHLGCAVLCFWSSAAEDADDEVGAPAIELAFELAGPKSEDEDLPPGPHSDASAAAPDSAQSAAKIEKTDLPKEPPDAVDDPDRRIALEIPQKQEPAPDQVKQQPSDASTAAVASEATAPTPLDTSRVAPTPRAPTIGAGRKASLERGSWQRRLVAHLDRNKRFPSTAARGEAEAQVRFSIDRLGHVLSSEVVSSSGSPIFDQAALAMLARASPVPPPPALVADEGLTFTIPVIFRERRQ